MPDSRLNLPIDDSYFRIAFEQAPVGMAYIALDGRYLLVNQALCTITGYSNAELLSRTFQQITHPEYIEAELALKQSLLAEQRATYTIEKRYLCPDGSTVWVRLTCRLVRDAANQPEYFLSIIENIARKKAALDALRLNEERFQIALQHSPVVLFNQDRDLCYTWIHNAALGMPSDLVLGRSDDQLLERQADSDRLTALKRQVLDSGIGTRREVMIWANQRNYYFDLTLEPLRDANGTVSGISGLAIDITRRVESEALVQRANERLNMAVEALDGFIYECDLRSGYTERSAGLARVLGYLPDAIPSSMDWWNEQIHPDDFEHVLHTMTLGRTATGNHSVEYRVRHRDGYYLYVWDRATAIFDEQGQMVRLIGSAIDITARKRSEERQRFLNKASIVLSSSVEYAARLSDLARLIVPSLADWCVINLLGEQGRIESVAVVHRDPAKAQLIEELCRLHPLDPQATHGTPHVIRTGESEFHPSITASMLQADSGSTHELELRQALGYGSMMIVPLTHQGQTIGAISFVAAGEGQRYTADDLVLAQDLASRAAIAIENARLYTTAQQARAAAEQASSRATFLLQAGTLLAASLDYQETLQRLAHIVVTYFSDLCVVFITGKDGIIQRAAAAHIDPAKERQLIALGQATIAPNSAHPAVAVIRNAKPLLNPPVAAALEEVAGDNPHQQLQSLIPHSHIIVPLIARSRVIGAMSFGRDTASRDYDASDLLVAEELAVRAALAIDNAMLYRDVQEAVQLRDAFFSIASHELKTPLTSLLGQAQLLQRRLTQADAAPERNQRSIQVILDQAQRLNKLLATLLDVSRLSLGQMIVAHEPLDLHALIQQVVGNFQHDLEHHTLIYRTSGQPFVVLGDMMRLEQVFQNLVQNAVKYSPQGGQIVVQAERRIDQVVISVIDHGIGIAAHELGNLFQRFYRVNNAAVQHINGMGIGLYIVKEIVTAHGGEVMVRSVEGQGSTFVVSLPLAEGAAEGVEGYAQHSSTGRQISASG